MTVIKKTRKYLILDASTKTVLGYRSMSRAPRDGSDVPEDPPSSEGQILQRIDDSDLGALSLEEFIAAKKPVFKGKKFDGWKDRSEDPQLVAIQDTNAKDDLSNTVTISVTGGDPDVDYLVASSRFISCSLSPGDGILNGSGKATFKIKVLGQDPLKLTISAEDHQPAELEVSIVPGDFV